MDLKQLKEMVRQEVRRMLKEGDVVDLGAFRKEKRDREDYYNYILVSTDGQFTLNPDDFVLVELDHRDQADALVDGDLDKAVELGASVVPLNPARLRKAE